MQVAFLGEYNFVNREMLVYSDNGKPNIAGDHLTIRHDEGHIFLLWLDANVLKGGSRNPRKFAACVHKHFANARTAFALNMILNLAPNVKCAHGLVTGNYRL